MGRLDNGAFASTGHSFPSTGAESVRCVLGFGFFEVENICKRRLLRSFVHYFLALQVDVQQTALSSL